jgi:hypothetical protein
MKVDSETCSVHYILYLRFYKISLFKMLDLFPIVKGFCVSSVNGKLSLNRIAKIDYDHLYIREENLSFLARGRVYTS